MKAIAKTITSIALIVLILTSCHGFSSNTPTPNPKNVMETAISVAFTMVAETQMVLPVQPTPQVIKSPSLTPAETTNPEDRFVLPNGWDGGLFSEEPCRAPCFAGLVPGTTTEAEAIELIQDSDRFQNCELIARSDGVRSIDCNGLTIGIDSETRIVDGIGFVPTAPFTLEEVVIKYGDPTNTWVAPSGIPEAPYIAMLVFFENEKIWLNLDDRADTSGTYLLEPSAAVWNVVYYSEENDGFEGYLQPWHGYGEYIIDDP